MQKIKYADVVEIDEVSVKGRFELGTIVELEDLDMGFMLENREAIIKILEEKMDIEASWDNFTYALELILIGINSVTAERIYK